MKIAIRLSLREVRRATGRPPDPKTEQRILCNSYPTLIRIESGLVVIKGNDVDLQLPGNYNMTIEALEPETQEEK